MIRNKEIAMNKLDNRHKILLCLLGLFLIVSVWQAYALSKSKSMISNKINSVELNRQVNFLNNTASNQSSSQTEYLQLVKQYQVAQIQRLIAENYAAIAQAREHTVRSMVQTAYLLDSDKGKLSNSATDAPVLDITQNYSLIYTGQDEKGIWTATLKKGDQTFDVKIGSELPDGYQVSSIDVDGVILVNATQKKMVTFSGVIQIKDTTPEPEVFPGSTPANPTQIDNHPVSQNTGAPMTANTESPIANTMIQAQTPANISSVSASKMESPAISPTHTTNRAEKSIQFAIAKMSQFSEILSFEYQTFFPRIHHLTTKIFHPYAAQQTIKTIKPVASAAPEPIKTVPAPTAEDIAATRALLEDVTALPSDTEALSNSDASEHTSAAKTDAAQAHASSSQKTQKIYTASVKSKETVSQANEINLKSMSADNGRDYTILLTENKKLGDIEALIKKAQLGNAAKYAEIINDEGNKFYVLTYGKYVKLTDAESALHKVSTKLKGGDAFITTFADIKSKEKRSDEPGVVVIK